MLDLLAIMAPSLRSLLLSFDDPIADLIWSYVDCAELDPTTPGQSSSSQWEAWKVHNLIVVLFS